MTLKWSEIEANAIVFSKRWRDCIGDERQEGQTFEKDLMTVFGVDWRDGLHEYQIKDEEGHIYYIDYLIPGKIIIEMKSKKESLIRAYNQAYGYVKSLAVDDRPILLVVSDFVDIQVTNLKTGQTFKKFKIAQLKAHVRMFGILAGYDSKVDYETDLEVNIKASYKLAKIHDYLKENGYIGDDLEVYLVRLLFCLFAEDTGIFESGSFENYLKKSSEDGQDLSYRIMALFATLNTPIEKRMSNLSMDLAQFRYINGSLFSAPLPPASFNHAVREALISCCDFDWSYISPAVFGAMFQGVMDEKERRELGAHYTSEENILKVIKPLFLDELWNEFEQSKSIKSDLVRFHGKISNLTFLDPACGCGNFLIITYRELRLLEFEILKILVDNAQMMFIDPLTLSKISISNFFGIEFEEFPCEIARVGMILIKHQMDEQLANYFGIPVIDFPIKNHANIIHGNALKIDWDSIISKEKLSYIVGNPPFVGASMMSAEQKSEAVNVYGPIKLASSIDYVGAWYYLASSFIQSTNIRCAFVSTNSICQGEQVSPLWGELLNKYNVHIDFAYRTFKWTNDAKGKAAVHCIIVGFSVAATQNIRRIWDENGNLSLCDNISPYLIPGPNIVVESRGTPLFEVPKATKGNQPTDDGNFIFSVEEKEQIVKKHPEAEQYFHRYIGAKDYINGGNRYCIWLKGASPDWRKIPEISNRIQSVQDFRAKSTALPTRLKANIPYEFFSSVQPETDYIAIPRASSMKRKYIPIGVIKQHDIASDSLSIVHTDDLFYFGVLISSSHMAWMRLVAGRLKSDYRYSASVVYNTFPWPEVSESTKNLIRSSAKKILEVRAIYSSWNLDQLYDPILMPSDLLKAHQENNKVVRQAYGAKWQSEEECVSDLLQRYTEIIKSKG